MNTNDISKIVLDFIDENKRFRDSLELFNNLVGKEDSRLFGGIVRNILFDKIYKDSGIIKDVDVPVFSLTEDQIGDRFNGYIHESFPGGHRARLCGYDYEIFNPLARRTPKLLMKWCPCSLSSVLFHTRTHKVIEYEFIDSLENEEVRINKFLKSRFDMNISGHKTASELAKDILYIGYVTKKTGFSIEPETAHTIVKHYDSININDFAYASSALYGSMKEEYDPIRLISDFILLCHQSKKKLLSIS